ncbi:MAG: PEP-CTERM sorting domain-containing protein [Bryobacteraceae bacterium]|nr:PEP-CTERM sorting domain-containing protein [Bryobacteraceae bacterium]
MRRPGAALTLPNSPVNAKLVVYPHSDDFLWEYYFKDGPRVFTYRTPRPILADVFIPISALESCTVATGPCSDLIHFNADYLGNSDMVMFREGFVQRLFTFPRLSLSREGEFRSGSASLTVRRIRDLRGTPAVPGDSTAPNLPPSGLPTPGGGTPTVPGGGTNPGEHPSEVPEPATFVLAAAGLAALALRRRVRQVPR